MENNQETVTQTVEKTEVTVENSTDEKAEVKTFTQEEVNTMLAKERKKMPSKEDMEAFNTWKESQKTEAQKQTELTQNNVDLTNRNALLEQKLAVTDADVLKQYRDFVQFTVSQMEGNFEDNLKDYLKNNPQYLKANGTNTTTENKDSGIAVSKINEGSDSGVSAILKQKHPELFK